MPVFRDDPEEWQRLDLRLLQNGSIHLYYSLAILAEDVEWLRSHNYRLDNFDCSRWETKEDMLEELASTLGFPEYYGKNLDALNDCLGDIDVPDDAGRVIVFNRYDVFTARFPD